MFWTFFSSILTPWETGDSNDIVQCLAEIRLALLFFFFGWVAVRSWLFLHKLSIWICTWALFKLVDLQLRLGLSFFSYYCTGFATIISVASSNKSTSTDQDTRIVNILAFWQPPLYYFPASNPLDKRISQHGSLLRVRIWKIVQSLAIEQALHRHGSRDTLCRIISTWPLISQHCRWFSKGGSIPTWTMQPESLIIWSIKGCTCV